MDLLIKVIFTVCFGIIGWFVRDSFGRIEKRFISIDNNLKEISKDLGEIKTYIAVDEEHKKNLEDKIETLGERITKLENQLSV